MVAITQIVDGLAGPLVMELNDLTSGVGAMIRGRTGLDLATGQLAAINDAADWSPFRGASPLGRRRITVPFLLIGSSADDLGARVAKLMAATQGPWWLRIRRHGASADSWLRCFGCVPQIDSQVTSSAVPHMAQGTITAETDPYALGARVDGGDLGSATSMDPVTNAWGININNVPGDTATPLLLRLKDADAFSEAMGAFISVRRRQTPGNLVASALRRQAEDGANTRSAAAHVVFSNLSGDSAMSGGSFLRATFGDDYEPLATSTVTFAAPTLSGPDAPGVYRMFVRIRRTLVSNSQQVVLRAYVNGAAITPEDIIVTANGAAIRVVDLGLVQWPSGSPPQLAAPLPNATGATPTRVTVEFCRKSAGAATLDFDFMAWIPADEDGGYLDVDGPLGVPSAQYVVIDGYQHLAAITGSNPTGVYGIVGQSYAGVTPTATWAGGVPQVRPGSNRLFVVAGISGVHGWPIDQTLNVAWSYWPRFTWLR